MKRITILIFTLFFVSFYTIDLLAQTYRIKVVPQGSRKYGYVDLTGKIVIEPIYKNAFDFSKEGTAHVFGGQKKLNPGNLSDSWLINVSGEEITNISEYDVYDDPWSGFIIGYREGMLRVSKSGKWGGLNAYGELVVPIIYDELTDFDDGFAMGKIKKSYYIVRSTGEASIVEGLKISYIKHFSEGITPVEIKGQGFGFMDTLGNMIIEPAFTRTGYFHAGFVWVRTPEDKIGYMNAKGEWLITPEFNKGDNFDIESGLALVRKGEKWAYLDVEGNVHYFELTDKAYGFSEGLAIGRKGNLLGYINNKGEYVIPAQFDVAHDFKNGYARVRIDGKYGLIDKSGNWIIKPSFKKMGEAILIE